MTYKEISTLYCIILLFKIEHLDNYIEVSLYVLLGKNIKKSIERNHLLVSVYILFPSFLHI